MQKNTTKTVVY